MSVGVIVPVHGWAPYLAETLDALVASDPDEIVVVDDCSPRELELLGVHRTRCRLVRLERRHGLAGARAAGLRALDSELVAFCDGDDVWEPGSLAERLAVLGDAAACFARARVVGPDNRPTGERWDADPDLTLPALYERNPLCVSGALLRRDSLERVGGPDSEFLDDWDLWLRLLGAGERLRFAPRAVVRYRRRAGALSANVAAIARAQLALHERHASLASADVVERTRRRDLRALADGLVRERRYREARETLRAAGERRALLALPGLRALAGRRDPFRQPATARRARRVRGSRAAARRAG